MENDNVRSAPDHPVAVTVTWAEDGFTAEGPKMGIDFARPRASNFPLQVKVASRAPGRFHPFYSRRIDVFVHFRPMYSTLWTMNSSIPAMGRWAYTGLPR